MICISQKKDNSNKIPFYNSSFIKTVTTYSIKTENDLHEYDVYANAHETHQKLLDYAKTQGWNLMIMKQESRLQTQAVSKSTI